MARISKTMSLNGSPLQRKPGCACGGACPRCRGTQATNAVSLQPKLTVNAPGDAFEQEADRVADHVMRMPAPGGATPASEAPGVAASSGTAPHLQRACAACGGGASRSEDEEEMVQAKEAPGGTPRVSDATAGRISSMRGGGEPLDRSVREHLEPRFGHDFGNVRIHRDAGAAQAARDVSARAFTVGGDIAFASGEYAPHTSSGMHLLAHELTHTIQQGASASVAAGAGPSVQRVPAGTIQRQDDATVEAGTGVGPAITAGTMTTDPAIHNQWVVADNCFGREGCNIRFHFQKAYSGDYNYVGGGGKTVRGVYVKIRAGYDATACGSCNTLKLLQVLRYTAMDGGTMQTAEPTTDTRRTRAGWNDPDARSRGWMVDAGETETNPYYSSSWVGQEGSASTPAVMWDTPGHWSNITNTGKEFNTCLICTPRSGASTVLA
ncbi:MAG TPA: DUF4157 domain-containing protein, partial [Candidatus Kapabacteria bacterium]|nr:DUF4157 domain-containing protein [Candidatus Kapabacteria bacterium]